MKEKSFWKQCAKPTGRPRIFKSPDDMWNRAVEYFECVDSNPWQQSSVTTDTIKEADGTSKPRTSQSTRMLKCPYTLHGLCAFWGVSKWADIKRTYEKEERYKRILDHIENIIISRQLDGGLLGLYNPGLVARLNRIADVVEQEVTVDAAKFPKLTEEDFARLRELNDAKQD